MSSLTACRLKKRCHVWIIAMIVVIIHRVTAVVATHDDFQDLYSDKENKPLQQRWPGIENDYEVVNVQMTSVVSGQKQIINTTANTEGSGHFSNITMRLEIDGQIFTLILQANSRLFAKDYIEKTISADGMQQLVNVDTVATNCHYTGYVQEYSNNSAAAVSTCYGIVGFFSVEGDSYHIEPLSNTCVSCSHKFYTGLPDAELLSKYTCGTGDGVPGVNQHTSRRRKRSPILVWPQDRERQTKIVRDYAIVDYSEYQSYNSNLTLTTNRVKTIVNMASALYQSQDIYVVLVGIEIWTTGSLISINVSNATTTLANFCTYAQNITVLYDDAQLIQAQGPFSGGGTEGANIIGLAYVGTMCSSLSCLFVCDIYPLPAIAASVMAHEMGHNFGLLHDTQYYTNATCPCDDPTGLCIMYPAINPINPATHWSTCSKSHLGALLPASNQACLFEIPTGIYQTFAPICGNGLVETGEKCDCGQAPSTECNSICCSNVTCQIVAPAQCAFGDCCNVTTCKFLLPCTECRANATVCDLSEYCSGANAFCPNDSYIMDFTSCSLNGIAGYCSAGQCGTQNAACQSLWGPGAQVANSFCYTFLNELGMPAGSCGINPTTGQYIPCSSSNALCGTLQCISNSATPVGTTWTGWSFTNYTLASTNYLCYSVMFANILQSMVPNGAGCGTSMACINQTCSSVSSVASTCPNCNSHGVCDNLGECYCDDGYAPPDCSQPGGGGSEHSNCISPTTMTPGTSVTAAAQTTVTATTLIATQLTTTNIVVATTTAAATTHPPTTISMATTTQKITTITATIGATTTNPTTAAATTTGAATTAASTTTVQTTTHPATAAATTAYAATATHPTTAAATSVAPTTVAETTHPTTAEVTTTGAATTSAATTPYPTTAAATTTVAPTTVAETTHPTIAAATTTYAATTTHPTTAAATTQQQQTTAYITLAVTTEQTTVSTSTTTTTAATATTTPIPKTITKTTATTTTKTTTKATTKTTATKQVECPLPEVGPTTGCVTRAMWRAIKKKKPYTPVNKIPVPAVIIHDTFTDTSLCLTPSDCLTEVLEIQSYQMTQMKGFSSMIDIAYNWLIGGDGNIYQGRGWDVQGQATKRWNSNTTSIAMIGDYRFSPPNSAAVAAAQRLICYGVKLGHISAGYTLYGHYDIECTLCPGGALRKTITSWSRYTTSPPTQCQVGTRTWYKPVRK